MRAGRGWQGALFLGAIFALSACGEDEGGNNNGSPPIFCDTGERVNPVSGRCELDDNNTIIVDPPRIPQPSTDPLCNEDAYMELLPTQDDISDLVSGYEAANLKPFIQGVLMRRYPFGAELMVGGLEFNQFDCVTQFVQDTSSAQAVLGAISTVVHECGHAYDINASGQGDSHYAITSGTSFTCVRGDAMNRGGLTFARSLINGDDYASARPPCNNQNTPGCDYYADVYLSGDPNDAMFDSGDQGFNTLLEEVVQYVNSLATGYALRDTLGNRVVSERDGILTLLWYMTRYLRMARLEQPSVYTHLSADPCWREAVLTTWARAWFYLEVTRDMASLGINDDALMPLATNPELVEEITRLRTRQICR